MSRQNMVRDIRKIHETTNNNNTMVKPEIKCVSQQRGLTGFNNQIVTIFTRTNLTTGENLK